MERKYAIRDLRKSKGLSQEALSEKIGLSRVQISNIECGVSVPSGPTLQRLARALGVDANDIDLSYADREAA